MPAPATRWYLKRAPWLAMGQSFPFALVVEEVAEPRRGRMIGVRDRRSARDYLPQLQHMLLAELGGARETRVYWDPAEADVGGP